MKKSVAELEKIVNKKFGEGTMIRGSDPELEITRIPTSILSIDWITGGGFARGRHAELFGNYSVGKTYTALRLIANAQKLGLNCSFVDVEKTFDKKWASNLGVDLDSLVIHRQEHGNRVVDFMETLLRSEEFDVIVLDSIAALLPMAELKASMEQESYGTQQAKLMSAALRRLTTANNKTVLIYLNQVRDSLGSVFQKRAVTSGGRAMGFYAGIRLEMVRTENIKKDAKDVDPKTGKEKPVQIIKGHRVLVNVEKEKTGGRPTGSKISFVFDYELGGIDPIEDLLYLGRLNGFIQKKGNSWWLNEYEDEKAASRGKFKSWLRKNKIVRQELEEQIRELIPNG